MNLPSILVIIFLAIIIGFIIKSMYHNRKTKKYGCSGNCGQCSRCH